jgi:para-nitrobenzyl esterase
LPGLAAAEAEGEKWTRSLGMANPTAAELRAIPVEKTLARAFPFIDGKVVTASPGKPFHDGTEAKVPLIIGANSDEASLASNTAALAKMILGPDYERMVTAYRNRPGVPADAAERDLAEDVGSVQQSQFIADLHAAHGGVAYTFYFDQQPVGAARDKGLGTEHGGEIEYLFGNKPDDHGWDAADRRTSKLMGDYWVRFAETGDPNGAGAPAWPKVAGKPTNRLVFHDGAHADHSSPLEEEAKTKVLTAAEKLWAAEAAR